jgi:uncharacterized membrane protein YoaK (UPF0700 family)
MEMRYGPAIPHWEGPMAEQKYGGMTLLPALLSLNGGFVDTAGFLALQGLFTAHVTGNFVTLGATLVLGTSGVVGKLLALPVFCVVVFLARLLGRGIRSAGLDALRPVLILEIVLLAVGAALAAAFGPFPNADAWPAILTGMVLVAAMAIQNAVTRVHLGAAPPTTLMTGTTTQIMIDLADLSRGLEGEARVPVVARMRRMLIAVVAFALGCALAALLYARFGAWCFLGAPVIALAGLLSGWGELPTGPAEVARR